MSRILVPSRGPQDWKALLADPERQWRPRFSAFAAAHSWESAGGLPREISALLGGEPRLELAIPEHKVAMPGSGRESQCDLFALVTIGGRLAAVAIEAKVDEPFGPTVQEWLADGGENRRNRLSTICGWLGRPGLPPAHLRYQLFHRTAAAVAEARRFQCPLAAMLVQSFSPDRRWHGDFQAFANWLAPQADTGTAHLRLPEGIELLLGWASCPFPEDAPHGMA